MESDVSYGTADTAPHPLAELLACPPAAGRLLNASSEYKVFENGQIVFRQGEKCRGLYLVVSGELLRKAERMETRLILGSARAGDLLELAALLGDGVHTYTLVGQSAGSLMVLEYEALHQAFRSYPPLRMQLLEELAREVSRAYISCGATRLSGLRRRAGMRPDRQN